MIGTGVRRGRAATNSHCPGTSGPSWRGRFRMFPPDPSQARCRLGAGQPDIPDHGWGDHGQKLLGRSWPR
jgi:hypothetical protein